jgi:hypothetical protein
MSCARYPFLKRDFSMGTSPAGLSSVQNTQPSPVHDDMVAGGFVLVDETEETAPPVEVAQPSAAPVAPAVPTSPPVDIPVLSPPIVSREEVERIEREASEANPLGTATSENEPDAATPEAAPSEGAAALEGPSTSAPAAAPPAATAAPAAAAPARPAISYSASALGGVAFGANDASLFTTGFQLGANIPASNNGTTIAPSLAVRNTTGERTSATGASAPVSNLVISPSVTVTHPLTPSSSQTQVALAGSVGAEFSQNSIAGTSATALSARAGANITTKPSDDVTLSLNPSVGVTSVSPSTGDTQMTFRPQVIAGVTYKPDNGPLSIGAQAIGQYRIAMNDAAQAGLNSGGGSFVAGVRGELNYSISSSTQVGLSAAHTFTGTRSSNDPFGGPGGISAEDGATTIGLNFRTKI